MKKQRERAGNEGEGARNERATPSPSFPQTKYQWEETENGRAMAELGSRAPESLKGSDLDQVLQTFEVLRIPGI